MNFLELKIEKLIYGGDGLARLPGDEHGRGKAVFVPFVLSGERVDASLVEEKPGFARAALNGILEPSRFRIPPHCPYFTRCGGCHYQHATYQHQLEIKASILKENLRRLGKLDLMTELQIHPSPPWNYRNRTRMRAQSQPAFMLGYNRHGSHELEAIEQCPISSASINRAITAVWKLGREGGIDNRVREIEFFSDADDSRLLLEIYFENGTSQEQAQASCEKLHHGIPAVAGVCAFPLPLAEEISETRVLASSGAIALQYSTAGFSDRVSAGSFFQTNRYLTDKLLTIVTAGESGKTALDLYAGVGLFAAVLSHQFERVIAVESSPQSFADLEYNSPGSVKADRATVDEYLDRAGGKRRADLILVDPPRGGLGRRVAANLATLKPPRLTYVSCDPATLARDLVPLLAAGYRVEQAHLVDLFPQTFHIESVLKLALGG
jgi:23S rRNA (uracil1939-C5)-methyltransferase